MFYTEPCDDDVLDSENRLVAPRAYARLWHETCGCKSTSMEGQATAEVERVVSANTLAALL